MGLVSADGKTRVLLPAMLEVKDAPELAREMRDVTSRGGAVSIDGDNVEWISTACVQILLAAARAVPAGQFEISTASPAFREALEELGVSGLLTYATRNY